MTPTEKLVTKVIQDEREAMERSGYRRAIMPRVIARTGVCVTTYWRSLRMLNHAGE